jgi:hypothetical protein
MVLEEDVLSKGQFPRTTLRADATPHDRENTDIIICV